MAERVRKARAELRVAEQRYHRAIARAYPVGSIITWDKGGHSQIGKVMSHSGQTLKVRNSDTWREYWIDAYHVLT
jgi:hypothetical protein